MPRWLRQDEQSWDNTGKDQLDTHVWERDRIDKGWTVEDSRGKRYTDQRISSERDGNWKKNVRYTVVCNWECQWKLVSARRKGAWNWKDYYLLILWKDLEISEVNWILWWFSFPAL